MTMETSEQAREELLPLKNTRDECFFAGAVGIEPTQLVLETNVLPLYEPPIQTRLNGRAWIKFIV